MFGNHASASGTTNKWPAGHIEKGFLTSPHSASSIVGVDVISVAPNFADFADTDPPFSGVTLACNALAALALFKGVTGSWSITNVGTLGTTRDSGGLRFAGRMIPQLFNGRGNKACLYKTNENSFMLDTSYLIPREYFLQIKGNLNSEEIVYNNEIKFEIVSEK